MAMKRCAACGRLLNPWPQIPNQQFCSEPDCQRERRRRKQQAKRKNNPVVRDSDAQYLRDWVAKNQNTGKRIEAEVFPAGYPGGLPNCSPILSASLCVSSSPSN
jgi:hypothetical protein